MSRNQSIDLLKLVSIFFVVAFHSPFSNKVGYIMDAVARFSVPMFFMITGYFVMKTVDISATLKKQMIKLTKYYMIYELVYILYELARAIPTMNFTIFNANL